MPRFSSVYDKDSKTSHLSLFLAHSKEIAHEAHELNLSASDGSVLAAVSPKIGCLVPNVVPKSFVENPSDNSADQNFDFNDFNVFEDTYDWITSENLFDDTTQSRGCSIWPSVFWVWQIAEAGPQYPPIPYCPKPLGISGVDKWRPE